MAGDELSSNVERWLGEQGYPLEMRVAAAFEKRGFRVFQSDFYEDPKSGEQREIDVMASIQRNIERIIARVAVMVECKVSRDRPWVVFTSESIKYARRASIAQRAGSMRGQKFLDAISNSKKVQDIPLFLVPERPAYAVTQALTTKADVAYAACMSAANAVVGHAAVDAHHDSMGWRLIDILLPVVVVEGRLFEAYLGGSSKPIVDEVQSAVLAWRNPVVGMPTTFIHIVTDDRLPAFVEEVHQAAVVLLSLKDEILRAGNLALPKA